MPDVLSNIIMGFGVALSWQNIGLCFLGCVIGTAIGVLPGIGPLTTMAMILPITFWIPPVGALIMLAGVFYGAPYCGSTTPPPSPTTRRKALGVHHPHRRPPAPHR